jgi:hypothetical protein
MLLSAAPLTGLAKEIFQPDGAITSVVKNEVENHGLKDKILDVVTPSFPSPSEWLGIKGKVQEMADEMHRQALLTPDPNDDRIDFLEYMRHYVDGAIITRFMPNWFKDFIIYFSGVLSQVTNNSVQFLFSHIYKFVTEIVLFTPEWIFGNDWFPAAVSNYSMLSIGIVVIFTMIEGLKRMCRMSHTRFRDTIKKFPIMLGVSAATPFLFVNGVKLLNKATRFIVELSSSAMDSGTISIFASSFFFEPINILFMVIFLIIVVIMCVPMVLLHARRWFDMIVLGMITPLSMSAWLFQSTEHYFHLWLRSIKNLAMIQLSYGVFISLLGVLMFSTPNPTTFIGMLSKSLVLCGAIYRLAYPPQFIKRFDDNGGGVMKWSKQMKEYAEDKIKKGKQYKDKGEDALVTGAKIAGKGYRFFFKK